MLRAGVRWLLAYVCLILLFAGIFSMIAGDFYHSNVVREPAYLSMRRQLTRSLNAALTDTLDHLETTAGADSVKIPGWMAFDELGVRGDGKIRFTATIMVLYDRLRPRQMQNATFEIAFNADWVPPKQLLRADGERDQESFMSLFLEIRQLAGPVVPVGAIEYLLRTRGGGLEAFGSTTIPMALFRRLCAFRSATLGRPGELGFFESFPRMLYFSLVTINTLGYGDIVPLTPRSRLLAGLESFIGVVVLGMFVTFVASRATSRAAQAARGFGGESMTETPPGLDPPPQPDRAELDRQSSDLWARILALQERFSYFILAVSGSASVFAIVKTGEGPAGVWVWPAMLAVLLWGASFMMSAWHLQLKVKAMLGDHRALRIQLGRQEIVTEHPELADEALRRLHLDKLASDRRSAALARRAFLLLSAGGGVYLTAHLMRLAAPAAVADSVVQTMPPIASQGSSMGHRVEAKTIFDALAALAALGGAGLGIYNWIRARSREKAEKRTEEADWQRWVDFLAKQSGHPATMVIQLTPGSDDHKWAERMVAKGRLVREAGVAAFSLKR